MTTITVSYGRKVPGPQEYSSESLHISIAQDLGEEALEDSDLRGAITALHELLKSEVDSKLQAGPARLSARPQLVTSNRVSGSPVPNGGNGSYRPNGRNGKASPKQISFLLGLANQRGLTFEQLGQFLEEMAGKRDPYELSGRDASQVIDALKQG